MPPILLVMLGGAFGSAARYLTGKFALAWLGPNYPWGTLAVNLIGGLLMGALTGILARHAPGNTQWWPLLGVGVLGGFTTFSSFSLDLIHMLERGEWGMGLGYILASVVGAALALFAGLSFARGFA